MNRMDKMKQDIFIYNPITSKYQSLHNIRKEHHMINRAEIEEAAERIAPYVRRTPIIDFTVAGAPVTLKLELLQHTGSFKPRGAFNRILSNRDEVPAAGVIAASGGNHGLATAYAARTRGYPAEIFVPEVCPPVKIARLKSYGATVQIGGETYAEALLASRERAAESGALVVHAYDQPEVVAGQGTTGRELEQQMPDVQTVLVAVGGGGFIGGIAAWFGGRTRIIGVEPFKAPTLATALEQGEPVNVEVGGRAVDSLGSKRVGDLAFEIAQKYVERVVLVEDDAILAAQRLLWDEMRLVVEPGGATALAALVAGAYRPAPGEKVAVLVCGSNTDPNTIYD
jgi:threonine dehydratase